MTQQKCQYNVDIWHAFPRNQIETDPEIRNRVQGWHSRDRRGTKIDGEPDLRRLAAGKTEQAHPPRLCQPAQGPRSGGEKPVALPTQVDAIIGDAKCVLLPSICYETFGRTVIEAYCKGTPVIVSDGGAIAELIRENETGYLFEAGNALGVHDIEAALFGTSLGVRLLDGRQEEHGHRNHMRAFNA